MLKKYFWAINLLFITGATYLLASTVNTYVTDYFEPPKALERKTHAKSSGKSAKRASADYKVIIDRNIFNSEPFDLVEAIEGLEADSKGPIQRSDLKVKLISTVVGNPDSYSVIEDLSTHKQDVYHLNEIVLKEAEIIRIERRRVILLRDGVEEALTFEESDPKEARQARSTQKTPAGGEGIRQVTDSSYLIDEDEVEGALDNLNELLTQIRVVPNFENGKTNGFKVFAIRPNSIFDKIGLKNGDILKQINDIEINSPEKALEIFPQLRNEKNLSLDIIRGGQRQSFSYEIR